MKSTTLILSLFLLAACKTTPDLPPLPNEHLFTPDLANGLCVEYALADATKVTFARVGQHILEPGGPCDHMRGFTRQGFKNVQNWIRDALQSN